MNLPKNNKSGIEEAQSITINHHDLAKLVHEALRGSGVSGEQAHTVTDCLMESELCGVTSHGVSTLPSHIKRMRDGGYNLNPDIRVEKDGASFAVVDADNAIGFVSATYCMEYAIQKSKTAGIFTVFSNHANTYGAAFYYPLLAAKQGLIGITFCNGPPAMPVSGGKEKLLGTNPFAVAVPYGREKYIIFDMATSKVAKSKINQARQKNEEIPLDWALDESGEPTADPIKAITGLVLPIEGYKGYGLSMTIDILAGVLSGASALNHVGKFYSKDGSCMDVGQTFIAIHPLLIYGDQFEHTMSDYVDRVCSSATAEGQTIRIPGMRKMLIREENINQGICIDKTIVESIKGLL